MGSYSIRDVSIVKQLDKGRKDLDSFKNSQFVSRRVLATRKIISQKVKSRTVNVAVGTILLRDIIYLEVTFKADYQEAPFGRLTLEFYDESDRLLDSDSGIIVLYLNDLEVGVNDGLLRWNLDVRASGTGTIGTAPYYVKLIVYATDTGRISWKNREDTI